MNKYSFFLKKQLAGCSEFVINRLVPCKNALGFIFRVILGSQLV